MADEQRAARSGLRLTRWIIRLVFALAIVAGLTYWGLPRQWGADECAPSSGAAGACIARFSLPLSVRGPGFPGRIALSASGDQLVVIGGTSETPPRAVLAAFATKDGRELWRIPLPADVPPRHVALSPDGTKAAVWPANGKHEVEVLELPGGKILDRLPRDGQEPVDRISQDVTFSQDGGSVLFGPAAARRAYPLSPTVPPRPVPGFEDSAGCDGDVGQSLLGHVRSWDNRIAAILLTNPWPASRLNSPASADRWRSFICAKATVLIARPDVVKIFAPMAFTPVGFSPNSDRLAHIYDTDQDIAGAPQVIEILGIPRTIEGVGAKLERIARFPIRGRVVADSIGWSPDGKRFAALIVTPKGMEARIFALP